MASILLMNILIFVFDLAYRIMVRIRLVPNGPTEYLDWMLIIFQSLIMVIFFAQAAWFYLLKSQDQVKFPSKSVDAK